MAFDLRPHVHPTFYGTPPASKRDYSGVLNLSSNELHHPEAAAFLQEFMAKQPPELFTRYPYFPRGVECVAEHHGLPLEQVLLSAGSDDAIRMLLHMLVGTSRRLILQSPNYQNYELYARGRGVDVQHVSFSGRSRQEHLEDLMRAAREAPPSLLAISNPNGFTGECLALEEVRALARECERFNHVLLVDEAYAAFAGMDHLRLLPEFENLVVARSYSKTFGMAGLRIASLFSSAGIIDYLSRWKAVNSVSGPALAYLEHCLNHPAFFQRIHQDIRQARSGFSDRLRRRFPRWRIPDSGGNFVLVILSSPQAAHARVGRLLKRDILVKELEGLEGGAFRITVGHASIMERVLAAIEDDVDEATGS
jgi:histidinol-phosphate aminotransferase